MPGPTEVGPPARRIVHTEAEYRVATTVTENRVEAVSSQLRVAYVPLRES